jgi:hypothetical protein
MKFEYLLTAFVIGTLVVLCGCTGSPNNPSSDSKKPDKQVKHVDESTEVLPPQSSEAETKNGSRSDDKQTGVKLPGKASQESEEQGELSNKNQIAGNEEQDPGNENADSERATLDDEEELYATPLPDIDENWQRLHPRHELWIDIENKTVVVGGWICLRAGMLEMFACPRNTKEHESVVSANARPELIHAALLALDIEPGNPARFDPDYEPAHGPKLEIKVRFFRDGEAHEVRSQELVRYMRTKEELDLPWIFAGSEFIDDWNSDRKIYSGNSGSFICVSNFPDATIDIPVRSTDEMSNLMFEANTDKIPPLGTRVLLLISQFEEKSAENPPAGNSNADDENL